LHLRLRKISLSLSLMTAIMRSLVDDSFGLVHRRTMNSRFTELKHCRHGNATM
jgi:hypothetical protein